MIQFEMLFSAMRI